VTDPFVASDPPDHDFGTVAVGQSASFTFPFTNHGLATSPPIAFSFSEPTAGFSLTADTCTGVALAHGATCTVTTVFTPPSTGTKNSWLDVAVMGGSSTHLSGTGN